MKIAAFFQQSYDKRQTQRFHKRKMVVNYLHFCFLCFFFRS